MHFTLFSDSGFIPATKTCVFSSVIEAEDVNEVVLLKPVKAGIVDSTVLELMGIFFGLEHMLRKFPNASSIEIVCDSNRAVAALNGDIGTKGKVIDTLARICNNIARLVGSRRLFATHRTSHLCVQINVCDMMCNLIRRVISSGSKENAQANLKPSEFAAYQVCGIFKQLEKPKQSELH